MAEVKRISHRVEDNGDVSIFLKDRTGRLIGSVRLSDSETKIHCWSVLSDIDPDELDATYATPEEEGRAIQHKILSCLARGPKGAEAVAQQLDMPSDEIGGRLMKLRNQGLIQKCDGKGRAGSVFKITGDGMAAWKGFSRPDHSGGKRAA